jgi:uncharacterized membrane protein HdeD (DUF308 family)
MILGLCALLFGIVAIVWPHLTFLIFLYIFGVYAVIQGCILMANAFYVRKAPELGDYSNASLPPGGWWILLGEGFLSIIAGLFCLFMPRLSAQGALYVIAVWTLFVGISSLIAAPSRGWLLGLIGILSLVISALLFFHSAATAQSILWLVGVCALVAGILLLVQSWLSRTVQRVPLEAHS